MDLQRIRRKNEHMLLAEHFYKDDHARPPFHDVRLIHTGIPEMSTSEVDTHVNLGGQLNLKWPFFIEAMTGGGRASKHVNAALARVAANHQLALATGSMSIALTDPGTRSSFEVIREINPDGLVFANLSASASYDQCVKAVKMIDADALELHLNAAQELIMPEGKRQFHWLDNIAQVTSKLSVPVIVKEVGFGMSQKTVELLLDAGVSLINVGGCGGTNFARIENGRADETQQLADLDDWGQTTPESLLEARAAINGEIRRSDRPQIIAAGGIVSPLDVIKAGAMGASACGVAGYFLRFLTRHGEVDLDNEVQRWQVEIKRVMTLLGCRRFSELQHVGKVYSPQLESYIRQRHLL